MENTTPRKKLPAGFWIGMGAAIFITVLLMGVAGFVLFDFFRANDIERNRQDEYSRVHGPDDRNMTKPDSINEDGIPIFTVVEEIPEFRGGDEARIKFLQSHIQYPQLAKESGIMGTVYVTFVVDENGKVTSVRVLRGIGGGCDEEALRVVRLMPPWKPGKQSGKNVRVQFNMPITFTLN